MTGAMIAPPGCPRILATPAARRPGSSRSNRGRFAPDGTPIVETKEVAPNVTIDVDEHGNLIGFEVLFVRLREWRRVDRQHAAE